jgi:hypothetical protein
VASQTPDIFGPSGAVSSETRVQRASRGLSACLASRLQARARGSILYNLTWKQTALPSGRSIWRLRASAGHISDSDLCGWPTPMTPSGGQTTPLGTSATGRRPDGSKATVTLQNVALLAGWPTCRSSDSDKNMRTLDGALAEIARKGSPQDLIQAAQLAGWATTTRDHRSDRGKLTSAELYGSKGQPLARQALYSDATGCSVTTPKSGLLNPAHSRWLLRLPAAWDDYMDSAMRSMRKR